MMTFARFILLGIFLIGIGYSAAALTAPHIAAAPVAPAAFGKLVCDVPAAEHDNLCNLVRR